ncbi:MAG: hypothetical protein IKT39_00850 [Clostridia bacterium]|nr:hypothetical protein [Clostridia bacterium]
MKKTMTIICLILALVLVGCSNSSTTNENMADTDNAVQGISETESVDNTEQIISAINEAMDGISLNEKYDKIYAKKDKSNICVRVITSEYVWDEVQENTSLKNSYKEDFSTIYNKAVEAAKETGEQNIPTIDVLVCEPDDNSVLATGSGTSNVTFLFE